MTRARPRRPAQRRPQRTRAIIGPLLIVVGVTHVGLTPVLYPDAVRSLMDGRLVGAIDADPGLAQLRGLGFWFATTGVGLIGLGAVVGSLEHHAVPLPRSLPWILVGIGVWGLVFLPRSPFWAFPILAVLAEWRRHRAASAVPRAPAGPHGVPIS